MRLPNNQRHDTSLRAAMNAALPDLAKVLFRREARMNNTLDLTVQPLLYTYADRAAPHPRCISPRFGRAGQRSVGHRNAK